MARVTSVRVHVQWEAISCDDLGPADDGGRHVRVWAAVEYPDGTLHIVPCPMRLTPEAVAYCEERARLRDVTGE